MGLSDETTGIAKSSLIGFAEMTAAIVLGFSLWSLGLPDMFAGLLIAVCTAIVIHRYYRRIEPRS